MGTEKRPSTATTISSTRTLMQRTIKMQNTNMMTKRPDKQKGKQAKRPDTAPASSTATSNPLQSIPFPVVIESLDANMEQETEEREKASDLTSNTSSSSNTKMLKVPEQLQPASISPRSSSSTLVLPEAGPSDEGSGAPDTSGGVSHSVAEKGCRLSWHPYACAKVKDFSEATSSDQEHLKSRESKKQHRAQYLTGARQQAELSSPPTSPMAINTSGSGSGSESSTRSPITPLSPLFCATSYARKGAIASPSGVGLGLGVKAIRSELVETQNDKKTSEMEIDSDGGSGNGFLKVLSLFFILTERTDQIVCYKTERTCSTRPSTFLRPDLYAPQCLQ